jgi:nitroreductase
LIKLRNDNIFLYRTVDEFCIECGHCIAACPSGSITLKNPKLTNPEVIQDFKIEPEALMELIKTRRSVRKFKQDKFLDIEIIEKIILAASRAPTGHNDQPCEFNVIKGKKITYLVDSVIKYFKMLVDIISKPGGEEKLIQMSGDKNKVNGLKYMLSNIQGILAAYDVGIDYLSYSPPVILIIHTGRAGSPAQDADLAAMSAMLMAHAMGLGTCSLGLITGVIDMYPTLKEAMQIPQINKVRYALSIGYPDIKFKYIPGRKIPSIKYVE